jgi:hypothetical protein
MVRYADDMVVLCKSRKQAEEAPSLISTWMNEAELELNHDKSRVVDMNLPGNYFDFLGYRFKLSKAKRMMQLIKPGSKQKLKQTIKPLTKRNNGYSMEAICNTVNPILRGWYNYFKHAKANEPFLPLSFGLRRLLLSFFSTKIRERHARELPLLQPPGSRNLLSVHARLLSLYALAIWHASFLFLYISGW